MGKDNWPNRWVKTDLETIVEKMANGANLPQSEVQLEGYLPISRIETIALEEVDLKRVKYVEADEKIIEKYALRKGDILFSHINSDKHLGKTAIFNGEVDLIHGINLLLIRAKEGFDKKLLNYLFKHYRFQGKFIDVAQRAVNQSSINQKKLNRFQVPLIPESEQKRIVTKLDALFGHLDVLREKLDRIPELLKNFRQQVLTQAVTGEMTKEWREGKGLGEWPQKVLSELIIDKPRNGYSPKGVGFVTEVKSLTLSATTKGYFDPIHIKYLDIERPGRDSHLWLKNGDILIQRSNTLDYVGTSAIYDGEDFDFIYPDLMMKLTVNNMIETKYLYFVLSTNKTKEYFRRNATGTAGNMPKINQGTVMATPIPYPEKEEQQEIVKRIESFFSLADKIESQYQILKANIDQLPQAILNKAFRGELVEQEVKDYVRKVGELRMVAEEVRNNI